MGIFHKLLKKDHSVEAFCSVIIVAAGRSERMGGIDKILCPIGNEPLIVHTLRPFQMSDHVSEILIVTREDLLIPMGDLCRERGITKVKRVVKGGESRTASVLAGIQEVDKRAELIAIHDGARPFLNRETLEEVIEIARQNHAAAPAIPVKDTIKRARHGIVVETPDRDTLFAVQTPQVFEADLIRAALMNLKERGVSVTDDCTAVEQLGFTVCLTQGSEENIKITTPADLCHAEAVLAMREGRW